jgi:putative DNA primase/helicase
VPAEIPTSEKALGHRFAREMNGRYLTTDGGAWWRYQDGIWRGVDRHHVLSLVERFLEPVAVGNQYARLIEAVTKIGGLRMHVPLHRLNAHPEWIALQNGVLDVKEKRWIDHAPTNLLTTQLPFAYNPDALCPRWRRFLNEVLVDVNGQTSMELIRLIQEWYGYCLIPDASAQTSMWWLGGGANGKGVATKVLEELVGNDQRVGVDIEQLHEPYHRASLYGKLLGIVGEIPLRAMIKNGARFKELVSGDTISARSPGKDVFSFTPYLRLLCTANELPRTFDRSAGYFRRLKLVVFRKNLPPEQQNPYLADELRRELPGIFNWSLEGLYRFFGQEGKFSTTPDADLALADYRHEEDPVARYVEDWCSKDPEATAPFTELWGCFRRWCKTNGEAFDTSVSFSRSLSRLGYESATSREGGRTLKVRKGLRIEVRGLETSFGDTV